MSISPVEKGVMFEKSVVNLLTKHGFSAHRTNVTNPDDLPQYKHGFDGGVDIIARFNTTEGNVYKDFSFYIQCKCHKSDITKQAISEVYAGMHHRKATASNCIPVVFCPSTATKETSQFARELGVELFLKEQFIIYQTALNGGQIPYDNYGILMKILLYKITNDSIWLDSLPDYQHNIGSISAMQQLLCASEADFTQAQSLLDAAVSLERRAQENRQKAIDIQKVAVYRAIQVSDKFKNRSEKLKHSNDTPTIDLDSG